MKIDYIRKDDEHKVIMRLYDEATVRLYDEATQIRDGEV